MGRNMSRKKSKLIVEFATARDLEDFLTAHQYLSSVALKQGQSFTSASRFGAICIAKEINSLARKLTEALEREKERAIENGEEDMKTGEITDAV